MSDSPAPSAPSSAPVSAPSPSGSKPSASAPVSGTSSSAPVGGGAPSSGASPTLPYQGSGGAPAPGNNHPDAAPGETKAETIQRLKFKVKVNGKEEEREFSTDEAQLHIQKGLGADEKFQEAANVRKAFQSFIQSVNEDPFAAFNDPAFGDLGKTYKDKVIQALAKEFQAEELKKADPKAYEFQQLQERVARFEAQEKARVESERLAAQNKADEMAWNEMKKSWLGALEKSGFGQNEALIRRMAMIGQDYLSKGMDLQPELLVSELKGQLAAENKLLMGGLKGESLANFLGPDLLKEVAAYQLAQAQKGKTVQEPLSVPEPKNTPENDDTSDRFDRPSKLLRSFKDFRDGK